MYRVVAIAGVAIAIAVAVGAQAETSSPNRALDVAAVGARVERIESRFTDRSDGGASLSSVHRGPRGKRGPRGPKGAAGPQGPAGPQGTFGTVTSIEGPGVTLCDTAASCAVQGASASCPPGTTVVGGGWKGGGIETFIPFSASVGNAWNIIAVNYFGTPTIHAVAMCASSAGP